VQITHGLKPNNKPKQLDFANDTLHQTDMDHYFLPSNLFSDEVMFHQMGKKSTGPMHTYGAQKILTSIERWSKTALK
jgi:hypothetical protein